LNNSYEVIEMEYSVVVHKAEEGGFWVEVPALPGCYSQGETVEDTLENVREAIDLYLEVLTEERETIPRDKEVVFKVSAGA
jgi:predicted RNase H-like HicB family nuclease